MVEVNTPFPKKRVVKAGIKQYGVLVRDEKWLAERITALEEKIKEYERRINSARREILSRSAELEELTIGKE